jgi:hypothetical protein
MASFDLTGIVDKIIGFLPADLQDKAKASRKAIVAGIGSLLTVLTLVSDRFGFLIPAQYKKPIGMTISILTTILTYLTPNEPAPQQAAVDPTAA